MPQHTSYLAVVIFLAFVGFTLGLSFWLGRKAKTAGGYFAAHGEIGWFVNGVAFAGDYLSAASFLGICGMIAFYGYDGFLYSIGFLAGWVVALFVIAEPIKRLGKYTFADALDAKFNSPGIKLAAGLSTLVVSMLYLIPQMVGAGALIVPLLHIPHYWGVITVGLVVILIVTTAGMVSTTWVQFIKGSMLVVFCAFLVVLILRRGIVTTEPSSFARAEWEQALNDYQDASRTRNAPKELEHYFDVGARIREETHAGPSGRVQSWKPESYAKFYGEYSQAPFDGDTGPLGPFNFLSTLRTTIVVQKHPQFPTPVMPPPQIGPKYEQINGTTVPVMQHILIPAPVDKSISRERVSDLLRPGGYFKGIRGTTLAGKLDFVSLMLALFCGTASLPHILIRYYTVKDAAAARKSTVVGIAAIGFFYVLTLYIGLGAMVSGNLDPADSNMAAPLLAKTFGDVPFAFITAIAFTTVLGTVSGLILACAGAVAHDLCGVIAPGRLTGTQQVKVAKITSVAVGVVAIGLGILFKGLNVGFLVGWAFNVAASANLPAIVMLLFWRGTTKQGMIASILVGLATSVTWLLLTKEAFQNVYGYPATHLGYMPFSQPGLVTIPLSFAVLVVVSLATRPADDTRHLKAA